MDLEELAWGLEVNTIGPMRVTRALLPNLERGEGRCIAMLSSKVGSLSDNTSGGNYAHRTTKAALNMVVKNLAIELAAASRTCVIRCVVGSTDRSQRKSVTPECTNARSNDNPTDSASRSARSGTAWRRGAPKGSARHSLERPGPAPSSSGALPARGRGVSVGCAESGADVAAPEAQRDRASIEGRWLRWWSYPAVLSRSDPHARSSMNRSIAGPAVLSSRLSVSTMRS